MTDIKQLLKDYAADSDRVLNELMDLEENIIAPKLLTAMRYTLFSGGKRLRPILTRMTAELLAGDLVSALKVGAALEMIHTYSLIHDDLPSMDNDDFRRGKATNHRVYGEGIAILAGDGLLTYAFNILANLSLPAEKIVRIIQLISDGAGINGMVAGQVLDLEAEDRKIGLKELKEIHRAKTGALFRTAILAGAFCADPEDKEIDALRKYANYLGLTFQIVDDILDVIGDEDKLGKKTGSDEELNKATYPKLMGLDQARAEAESTATLARESLNMFGEKADNLLQLIDYILIRQC